MHNGICYFGSHSMVLGSKDCWHNTHTAGGALRMIYLLRDLSIPAERGVDLALQEFQLLVHVLG